MIDDDAYGVVFDIGSGMCKCGFTGDDAPRAVGMDARDCFVGDEAQAKRGILNLNFPVPTDNKSSINWEDLERVFFHCPYNELKYTPEYGPLVLNSFHSMDEKAFEVLSEILLEKHGYLGILIVDSSVSSMFASGKYNGLSIDLGHGNVEVAAIFGSLPIQHSKIILEDRTAEKRTRIGGKLIGDTLKSLCSSSGSFKATNSSEREIIRDIKEKLCFIEINEDILSGKIDEDEVSDYCRFPYELPDGNEIQISRERYLAPEILFNPSKIGYNLPGIHKLIKMSIELCEEDLHEELYKNIVLTGGSSMFEGLAERIEIELRKLTKSKIKKIKVHSPCERKFNTWIGGSIMGSLRDANKNYCTVAEYKEFGYSLVERKSQTCTRYDKQNNQHLILSEIVSIDIDLKERMEYILFDCFSDDISNSSFRVIITGKNDNIQIRFKSLMML